MSLEVFPEGRSRFGDAPALLCAQTGTWSYARLQEICDELAARMQSRALAFLLGANSAPAIIGYLAMLKQHVPVAMLPGSMPEDRLRELLDIYRPRYVWLPRARSAILPGGLNIAEIEGYVLIDTGAPDCACDPQLALLMTTSGSTGSPKFVRQSYRNLAANTASIVEYLGITARDRAITTLPMNYVYGLSIINSHLACGASVVLTEHTVMEKPFWELLNTERVTNFGGVPYTFQMLRRLRFGQMDLPHLRLVTQAGGKLVPEQVLEMAEACAAKGIAFVVMYGAAEATARMSYLPSSKVLEHPESIGIAIPGGALSLIDEDGRELQGEVTGELVYRGPNVALGYALCREDLARGDDNAGALVTGDLARRNGEGLYTIVGRRSRFLKLFGNRISLEHVEQHLASAGIEVACSGDDTTMKIYLTHEEDKDRASSLVRQLTGLHPQSFRVTLIPAIPRNEAGKILYSELP